MLVSDFVATNIFVRFLTGDVLEKAVDCSALLQRSGRGEIDLETSGAVIAEVVYVLSSPRLYGKSRNEIGAGLEALLVTGGLHLDHKTTVLAALQRYRDSTLSFVDCLCVEHALRLGQPATIFSYDRGLDRVPGICRLEP